LPAPLGPFLYLLCIIPVLINLYTFYIEVKNKLRYSIGEGLDTKERKLATMQAVVYVGERLKALRIRRALTQQELAERADLSSNALNRIELDKAEPRMSTLRKLAKALDVDPAEIVGE
jgi:DNA-binding XRE family transcriptional regulator